MVMVWLLLPMSLDFSCSCVTISFSFSLRKLFTFCRRERLLHLWWFPGYMGQRQLKHRRCTFFLFFFCFFFSFSLSAITGGAFTFCCNAFAFPPPALCISQIMQGLLAQLWELDFRTAAGDMEGGRENRRERAREREREGEREKEKKREREIEKERERERERKRKRE